MQQRMMFVSSTNNDDEYTSSRIQQQQQRPTPTTKTIISDTMKNDNKNKNNNCSDEKNKTTRQQVVATVTVVTTPCCYVTTSSATTTTTMTNTTSSVCGRIVVFNATPSSRFLQYRLPYHQFFFLHRFFVLFLLFIQLLGTTTVVKQVEAVVPQLAFDIVRSSSSTTTTTKTSPLLSTTTYLASHALFGTYPRMGSGNKDNNNDQNVNPQYNIVYPNPYDDNELENNDPLFCSSSTKMNKFNSNSIVFIPRGECTFETKVRNAQSFGAAAVIIYGTLRSRYSLNRTTTTTTITEHNDPIPPIPPPTMDDIVWPLDRMDYDCTKGRALIPSNSLSFTPLPYNGIVNDPLLIGGSESSSLCYTNSPDQLMNCESKMCLLTGKELYLPEDGNGNKATVPMMEACCAWDLHIWLYPDSTIPETTNHSTTDQPVVVAPVTIPVAYLIARQAQQISDEILSYDDEEDSSIVVTTAGVLYARWRPYYNSSAILIWVLGVMVAAIAAYTTGSEYRQLTNRFIRKKSDDNTNNNQQSTRSNNSIHHHHKNHSAGPNHPEEILELTPLHAVLFVIMASSSLLILFYFKIYGIVKVFYAIGCSTAVSQVIVLPFVYQLYVVIRRNVLPNVRNFIVYRSNTEEIGDVTILELIAFAMGYTLGAVWLYMAITIHDPERFIFFWLMQDIFGTCMCITFLKVIRLNSIRVAAILLIVAFFYDIFFVFITPWLFHGQSVMVTVATSGGPPKADALWCEKYPKDVDCQGGNPMPMLLAIPRIQDYMGGSSLLGLGDIVLPGLLLSFGARYDAAKALVGVLSGGARGGTANTYGNSACPEPNVFFKFFGCAGTSSGGGASSSSWCCCCNGYFVPLIISYAVGLAMANTAVYVMRMGQPALLYLVPCCLGTLLYLGYKRNEMKDLWEGPKLLKTADDILYGGSNTNDDHDTNQNQNLVPESNDDHDLQKNGNALLSTSTPTNNRTGHVPLPMTEENSHDAIVAPSAVESGDDDN